MVVVTSFRAEEITRQLDEMGIHKYYVSDGGKEYIRYRHQEMLLEYIRGEADRKGWVQKGQLSCISGGTAIMLHEMRGSLICRL